MALTRISRRNFLKLGATSVLALSVPGALAGVLKRNPQAGTGSENSSVVVLFLRGGCDALSLVFPVSGADRVIYEQERRYLKIPLEGPDCALPLDDFFGLHPAAGDLHRLFREKELAFIHATGIPVSTRSHFEAQDIMDRGMPDHRKSGGWITRLLRAGASPRPFPAVTIGPLLPLSLSGFRESVSISDFSRLQEKWMTDKRLSLLKGLYTNSPHGFREARTALSLLEYAQASRSGHQETGGRDFRETEIGNKLETLVDLFRYGVVPQVATIDMEGWDTHRNQGTNREGPFRDLVSDLSAGVGSFFRSLDSMGENRPRVTMIVVSEFGRRLRENSSLGTEHGYGGLTIVAGDGVRGGKVYGDWPGLGAGQLYMGTDLQPTTDYRQVISELLAARFGFSGSPALFPDLKVRKPLGFMAG